MLDVDECRDSGCRAALRVLEAGLVLGALVITTAPSAVSSAGSACSCFPAFVDNDLLTRRLLTVFSFSQVSTLAGRAFPFSTILVRTEMLASSSTTGGGSTSGVVLRRLLTAGAAELPRLFVDADAPPALLRRLCVAGTVAVLIDDAENARGRLEPEAGAVEDAPDTAVSRTTSETGPPEGRGCMLPTSALFFSFSLGCLSRVSGRAGTAGMGVVSCSGGAGDRSAGTDFRRVTGRVVL